MNYFFNIINNQRDKFRFLLILVITLLTINLSAIDLKQLNSSANPNWVQNREGIKALSQIEKKEISILLFSSHQSDAIKSGVIKGIQKALPSKKIALKIASTYNSGSITAPFSLPTLLKENFDLIIFNSAAEDSINSEKSLTVKRAVEGAIRTIKKQSPNSAILMLYLSEIGMIDEYISGKTPIQIANHEKIANYYNIPTINICNELFNRITKKEIQKESGIFDNNKIASIIIENAITRYIKSSLTKSSDANTSATEDKKLQKPLDWRCFDKIAILPISKADNRNEYSEIKESHVSGIELFGEKAPNSTISTTSYNGRFAYYLNGTLLGFWAYVGPNAGIIRCRIDGTANTNFDLYRKTENGEAIPRLIIVKSGMDGGFHYLQVSTANKSNPDSKGNKTALMGLLTNGK